MWARLELANQRLENLIDGYFRLARRKPMIDLVGLADRMAEALLDLHERTREPACEGNDFDKKTLDVLREYWGEGELAKRLRGGA